MKRGLATKGNRLTNRNATTHAREHARTRGSKQRVRLPEISPIKCKWRTDIYTHILAHTNPNGLIPSSTDTTSQIAINITFHKQHRNLHEINTSLPETIKLVN